MADLEARFDRDVKLLADELHERVRTLNQLLDGPTELTRPESARTVLGSLAQTSFRLVEIAEQIDAFLDRGLTAGRFDRSDGQDPTPAMLVAHDALAVAVDQSRDLGESFRQAHGALADIHGTSPEGEPSRAQAQEVVEKVATKPDRSDGGVVQAARDFPSAIGDLLPRPGVQDPASPPRRPAPRPPDPRREL